MILRIALLFVLIHTSLAQLVILPFSAALKDPTYDSTIPHQELVKRDGNCPSGYDSCGYLNIPGYCCPDGQNCAVDSLGHAACCPTDAVCTGNIGGTGFVNGGQNTLTQTAGFATAAITAGTGTATTTFAAANGAATETAFSVLRNPFYPFKIIPTTYLSAGACSAAWTGCQTDMASCTRLLEGIGGGSVTISAPNFVTTQQVTKTYPSVFASSVCSSLSLSACSGLQVNACSFFGGAGGTENSGAKPTMLCGAGVGAVVGVAGQWLLG
jgi:hypothetical protein